MIRIQSYLPVKFEEIKFGNGTGYTATLYYDGGVFKASAKSKVEAEEMIAQSIEECYPELECYSMEAV